MSLKVLSEYIMYIYHKKNKHNHQYYYESASYIINMIINLLLENNTKTS